MAIGDVCKIKTCKNLVTQNGAICNHHRHLKSYYGSYDAIPESKLSRIEFFNANIKKSEVSDCILWCGRIDKLGYGMIWNGQKAVKAHRFSWELVNGKIPDGINCLHKCDIRNCVNVEHLFLGSQQDNIKDMVNKKRNVLGWQKLNPLQVKLIKKLISCGCHDVDIATAFNVHRDTIRCIRNGKNWSHISE